MADMSFDEARAKIWADDVRNEIESVEIVLKKVTQASIAIPGEDDDIMKGIEATCRALTNFWDGMIGGFKKTTDAIDSGIKVLGQAVSSLADAANTLKSKIGL